MPDGCNCADTAGSLVAQHHDLERMDQLEEVLAEFVALVRDREVPPHAVTPSQES